ncbi:hypothetical protein NC797_12110 [Aquibacillus sp. 3ASR75-11]|uniref:Gas vesicle protein n=1 Tax=Terrihalobacillus insolitus TaxID=2950438 RepID=A0A9X3WSN2_9BACI|nr:hypothetical protein [Terrihalobacillus insolitus]MDC3413462.1 hypothetical protein [Terrihalobacillus insolitus]MDC3425247.1 hypothetical protein [Terrihalobacillus insolitus]
MARQRFFKGMAIGAVVGGFVTLLDKDTRNDVWSDVKSAGKRSRFYVQHPSEVMNEVRDFYESSTFQLSSKANSVLAVLTQIQETLDKLSQLEANKGSVESVYSSDTVYDKNSVH